MTKGEKRIETEKGTVYYWYSDVNAEDTMVFLHGLTANHHLFHKQIRYFQRKYNCIAWDAPMHGSSRPYSEFSFEDMADVLFQILDRHSVKRPILIGQSMGTYIIQSFLIKHPHRAKAFISIDGSPYGKKYYSKSDLWLLQKADQMIACCPDKLLKKTIAKQNAHRFIAQKNMYAMLSDYTKAEIGEMIKMGYRAFLESNQDMEFCRPVLLICGEEDNTGKVKKYNREWAEDLGTTVRWIPDAGHNSNDDRPDLVNKEIEQFVKGL